MKSFLCLHKKFILQVICLCFLLHTIFAADAQAQSSQTTAQNNLGWERLTINNGEFSIWMPAGFTAYNNLNEHYKGDSDGAKFYEERRMSVYLDGVLFVVSAYKVSNPKRAVKDLTVNAGLEPRRWQNISVNGFKGKKSRTEKGLLLHEIQYFMSETYVYALEVGARDAANPLVKAFLSSLRLGAEAVAQDTASPAINISGAVLPPNILEVMNAQTPGITKAAILSKTSPPYTDKARDEGVNGVVVLTMVLLPSGEVANIEVVSGLKHGLTEQAIKVAKQIIFIPAELNGRPVAQRLKVEYNFNIFRKETY